MSKPPGRHAQVRSRLQHQGVRAAPDEEGTRCKENNSQMPSCFMTGCDRVDACFGQTE